MRRIGALISRGVDDPEGQVRVAAFKQGLQQLGWTDGHNVRIDVRWGEDDADGDAQIRGGIGCARARTSSWPVALGVATVATGDPNFTDRVRGCR